MPAHKPEGGVGQGRIDYLDGWRGLAIVLVLQAHFFPIQGFERSGFLGVDMFFCLSGVLMSRLLFVKRTPLLVFYERRINRILPTFFLFVVTVCLVGMFTGKTVSGTEVGFTLAFLRTYLPVSPDIWSSVLPIGHLWSLNVEEHSYILMSLLTLGAYLRRHVGVVLLGIGSLAVLVHVYYATHPLVAPPEYYLRTECAMSFVMISAGYSLHKHRISPYVKPAVPLVALLAAAFCYCDWFPVRGGWALLGPVLLSFAVNHLSESGSALIYVLRLRALRLMGLWSYSIYLWQQPIYQYQHVFLPGTACALAILVGVVSYYWYENPMRIWLNEHKHFDLIGIRLNKGVT